MIQTDYVSVSTAASHKISQEFQQYSIGLLIQLQNITEAAPRRPERMEGAVEVCVPGKRRKTGYALRSARDAP
jgi:hypothetical protein